MAAQIQNRDRNSPSQRNITPPSSMEFSAAISAPGSYNHCKSGLCRMCTYTYLLVFWFLLNVAQFGTNIDGSCLFSTPNRVEPMNKHKKGNVK